MVPRLLVKLPLYESIAQDSKIRKLGDPIYIWTLAEDGGVGKGGG